VLDAVTMELALKPEHGYVLLAVAVIAFEVCYFSVG
jgi:hypothetical protein